MNFVFFSTIAWNYGDGAHTPTQLARELTRRGHRVLFAQAQFSTATRNTDSSLCLTTLAELGLPDAQVKSAWYGAEAGALDALAAKLNAILETFEQKGQPRVALWFAPFAPFVRLLPLMHARGYTRVYYCLDDFAAIRRSGEFYPSAAAEELLLRAAEVTIALSPPVAEKLSAYRTPVHVIPDGINRDEFRGQEREKVTAEVRRGECTLGFWGMIADSMVDAELVANVARTRPKWAIHFIGAHQPSAEGGSIPARLKSFDNIRFHGYVPRAQLPAYAAAFDVCIVPAPDSDFSRGRDPLKVYEYLACYKPVVSAHMPQLARMPYVFNANTPIEFIEAVERAGQTQAERAVIDEFLSHQTWAARVDTLLQLLELIPPAPSRAPSEPEKLVAPSLQEQDGTLPLNKIFADLAHVERELQATQQWARELEAQIARRDRELNRIRRFSPFRVGRTMRGWLSRSTKR